EGAGAPHGNARVPAQALLPRARRPDVDPSRVQTNVDTSKWSGAGTFTHVLLDHLRQLDAVTLIRIEDATASRSEADYNFISNEIYVAFVTAPRTERVLRFGFLPASKTVADKAMTMTTLEGAL